MDALIRPRCWDALEQARTELADAGGSRLKALDHLQVQAGLEARQFLYLGSAYVGWSPGNGTCYPFLLHDLDDAQYRACLHDLRRVYDPEELTPELVGRLEKLAREKAANISGAAGVWGGRLLIAMPGFQRTGSSIAVALMDYYHPGYIAEALRLLYPDAVPVAEFLSLFGHAVGAMERGEW